MLYELQGHPNVSNVFLNTGIEIINYSETVNRKNG